MTFYKLFFINIILLISVVSLHGQQSTIKSSEDQRNKGTINNQFEYVITKSYTFKSKAKIYKNIEQHWLTDLKRNTLDSLKTLQTNLNATKVIVTKQNTEIESLKADLSKTQDLLKNSNAEKDKMSLFGFKINKIGYNLLLWSIIVGVLVLLIVFILRFKNSNSITKEANRKLQEIETEYEEHRRIALEREQKVRRQLQDEINKNKSS